MKFNSLILVLVLFLERQLCSVRCNTLIIDTTVPEYYILCMFFVSSGMDKKCYI